jgi:ubiquinone/menaquinone biosynthesis C-methylase UbiE
MKSDLIHQRSWGIDTQAERLESVLKYSSIAEKILDLGTGRGAYVRTLCEFGFKAIGVDQVDYAEWEGFREYFVQADAHNLPFADKQFDTTICFEVLEHCPCPENVLSEIIRCTKSKIILSVPDCSLDNKLRKHDLALAHWTDPTHCNQFTKDSLLELLLRYNLNILEIGGCYKVFPSNYFWDSIRLPRLVRKLGQKISSKFNLFEEYYSSILVVAEI